MISWSTATEINNSHFEIEKLTSGKFSTLGTVIGSGNSTSTQEYTWTDPQIQGTHSIYRIKQLDFDGRFNYSPVVRVLHGNNTPLVVFPNPTSDQFTINCSSCNQEDNLTLELTDIQGRVLLTGAYNATTSFIMDVSDYPNGTYFLRLHHNDKMEVSKVVIMHDK